MQKKSIRQCACLAIPRHMHRQPSLLRAPPPRAWQPTRVCTLPLLYHLGKCQWGMAGTGTGLHMREQAGNGVSK